MKLVLATGNEGKLREFRELLGDELLGMHELTEPFEIVEDASTFGGNALIKARALHERLGPDYLVLSDDSGISVPALGGAPGIYSARYAGEGADDRKNRSKLVSELAKAGLKRTPAYYTAAVALVGSAGAYLVHGWMHGEVIDQPRGERGFGYDPLFIPEGYERTLGELEDSLKASISHRARAVERIVPILSMLRRGEG